MLEGNLTARRYISDVLEEHAIPFKEHADVDHEYIPKIPANDHNKRWSHTVLDTVHFDFRWCFDYARRLGYR